MEALRGFAVLALGFAAVFLVLVAFLAAGFAAVAFLAGAFLVAGLGAAGFLSMISTGCCETRRAWTYLGGRLGGILLRELHGAGGSWTARQ